MKLTSRKRLFISACAQTCAHVRYRARKPPQAIDEILDKGRLPYHRTSSPSTHILFPRPSPSTRLTFSSLIKSRRAMSSQPIALESEAPLGFRARVQQKYIQWLDTFAPYVLSRWLFTSSAFAVSALRIASVHGWLPVCYVLVVYLHAMYAMYRKATEAPDPSGNVSDDMEQGNGPEDIGTDEKDLLLLEDNVIDSQAEPLFSDGREEEATKEGLVTLSENNQPLELRFWVFTTVPTLLLILPGAFLEVPKVPVDLLDLVVYAMCVILGNIMPPVMKRLHANYHGRTASNGSGH
ncbi:hypothetical protein C8Q80DRAFT_494223 [Daedaleopsis nitida]|nr:hypothetical protein C8Q80DRAFT_494223 [Daedaleopsis nitida]